MYGFWPPSEPEEAPPRATLKEIKVMYKELAAILAKIEKTGGEVLELHHTADEMRISGQSGQVQRSPLAPGYWEAQ